MLADLDAVERAAENGTLKSLGNWTPGQILSHLAAWIEYGYNGYPMRAPPWFIRWILRLKLKSMLRDGMPAGVWIPGVKEGTTGADAAPNAEALQRLRGALARLQRGEPASFHSPAFGPMSHDDRVQLNLRHGELHLSFLQLS